jgi:hypothetical protein
MAIIQGEGLELSEVPSKEWTGETHPGRIRMQTFRPRHGEPLTDMLVGQGMASIGGGGYGGGGLPYASEVLQVWGGEVRQAAVSTPAAPRSSATTAREAQYALVAVGAQGRRAQRAIRDDAGLADPLGQRSRRRYLRDRSRCGTPPGRCASGSAKGVDGSAETVRGAAPPLPTSSSRWIASRTPGRSATASPSVARRSKKRPISSSDSFCNAAFHARHWSGEPKLRTFFRVERRFRPFRASGGASCHSAASRSSSARLRSTPHR